MKSLDKTPKIGGDHATGDEMPAFAIRSRCRPEKKEMARNLRRNATPTEQRLWDRLRRKALGVRVRRQSIILGYIADFYVPAWRLVIELDGASHADRQEYDTRRDAAMNAAGVRVVRFPNAAVWNDIEGVLKAVLAAAK